MNTDNKINNNIKVNKDAIRYYMWHYCRNYYKSLLIFFSFVVARIVTVFLIYFNNKNAPLQTEFELVREIRNQICDTRTRTEASNFAKEIEILNLNNKEKHVKENFSTSEDRSFIEKVFGILLFNFHSHSDLDAKKHLFASEKFIINYPRRTVLHFLHQLIFDFHFLTYFFFIFNIINVANYLSSCSQNVIEEDKLVILNTNFTRDQIFIAKLSISLTLSLISSLTSLVFYILMRESYSFSIFQEITFLFLNFFIFPPIIMLQRANFYSWLSSKRFKTLRYLVFSFFYFFSPVCLYSLSSIFPGISSYCSSHRKELFYWSYLTYTLVDLFILIKNYYRIKKLNYRV